MALPSAPDATWKAASGAINTLTFTHTCAAAVPAGKLVIALFTARATDAGASQPTIAISDSKSNTWSKYGTPNDPYLTIAWSVISTPLTTSDTISFSRSSEANWNRAAAEVMVWDFDLDSVDDVTGVNEQSGTTSFTSGAGAASGNCILVGGFATYNPNFLSGMVGGLGWASLGSTITTAGSANRGMWNAYQATDDPVSGLEYKITMSNNGGGATAWWAFYAVGDIPDTKKVGWGVHI